VLTGQTRRLPMMSVLEKVGRHFMHPGAECAADKLQELLRHKPLVMTGQTDSLTLILVLEKVSRHFMHPGSP
jgi:hypothetical protein